MAETKARQTPQSSLLGPKASGGVPVLTRCKDSITLPSRACIVISAAGQCPVPGPASNYAISSCLAPPPRLWLNKLRIWLNEPGLRHKRKMTARTRLRRSSWARAAHMGLHCGLRHHQLLGDLGVGQTDGHLEEHFLLTAGELIEGGVRRPARYCDLGAGGCHRARGKDRVHLCRPILVVGLFLQPEPRTAGVGGRRHVHFAS